MPFQDAGIPEQHIVENFWPHRRDHRSVQTVVAVYLAAHSSGYARDEATNKLPMPPGEPPQAAAADPGPSIFTALEAQLGLKLEKTTGPAEYLVIESVERPSEN